MIIKGKKVILRGIEHRDLELLNKWSNEPEITYMLGGWHFPSSLADQEIWFNSLAKDDLNKRFAIETPDAGMIGMSNLVHINWKDRNAFHGLMIGEKNARKKGYGEDTVMAISRYAFEELGMHRMDTTIISYNDPSIALYTNKCGWKTEGVKKEYYFRKNKWWDQLILGITRDEYFHLIEENDYWTVD